jgi:hypothetical protein
LGGHPRYNIGDRVNVTCASRDSLPASDLSWYINGEKADKQFILYYPEEESYTGLRTAKLGLSFKVNNCVLKAFEGTHMLCFGLLYFLQFLFHVLV